ncbi:MAG: hypothetical protein KME16_20015 [Scytolyngbya sp. HA4215-MV1]|nr:hypothetical protein [Scytolyngbya sp. HA4215-MV1]
MTNLFDISKRIEDSMYRPTLPSLKEIQQQMQPHVADVSEVLRRYCDLVDKYYEESTPFTSKDATQDLTNFIELIGFSTIIGSYYLIEKWCIQRLPKNSLAKPLAYYISKLEELCNNPGKFGLKTEAKPYIEHLIKQLQEIA